MSLKYLYSILPGKHDLKNRRNVSSFLGFLLFTFPLILIITHYSLFIDGLESLGLSVFLIAADFGEFKKVFNPEIVEYWVASLFVLMWWIGVTIMYGRRVRRAQIRTDENISPSQWHLVWSDMKKNRMVLFFIITLTSMYIVAFLCPWLAPHDPNDQQDIVVTKYASPFQRIAYLKLRTDDRSILPFREGESAAIAGTNRLIVIQHKLMNREAAVEYVNSFEKDQKQVRYVQGIQKKTIPLSDLRGVHEEEFIGHRLYLLGSDKYGRDIFSRLLYGSRISLSIGFLAMAIAVTLGTVIGAIAGYFGKRTDAVLMRWVDLMLAFPNLFLILMIVALFGNSIFLIVVILGLTGWMGVSRIVRGQFLALREMEYIQAAHALGFGHTRIIFKHLIPNAFSPVIVAATLRLGGIILVEAGLSFLGVGVQPPTASWGNMVAEGRDMLINAWWISTFPGLAIVLTVICFNMIGDGLRDALDPRLRT